MLKKVLEAIDKHKFIGITGKSGGGKTTLLEHLYHHINQTKKTIYVPQFAQLFPHHSVKSNMVNVYPDNMIKQYMDLFDMGNISLTYLIDRLSGGEKQRIIMIRTWLFKAEIYLYDEPTSALDASNIQRFIKIISKQSGIHIIISHNNDLLQKLCTKVFII